MPINSVGLCLIIRKICLDAREHETVVAHVGAVEAVEAIHSQAYSGMPLRVDGALNDPFQRGC